MWYCLCQCGTVYVSVVLSMSVLWYCLCQCCGTVYVLPVSWSCDVSPQVGRFFGEVDGSVMAAVIKMGIYKKYDL